MIQSVSWRSTSSSAADLSHLAPTSVSPAEYVHSSSELGSQQGTKWLGCQYLLAEEQEFLCHCFPPDV